MSVDQNPEPSEQFNKLLIYFCTGCHQDVVSRIAIDENAQPLAKSVVCSRCRHSQFLLPYDIKRLQKRVLNLKYYDYKCDRCGKKTKVVLTFNLRKKLIDKEVECPNCHEVDVISSQIKTFVEKNISVNSRLRNFFSSLFLFLIFEIMVVFFSKKEFVFVEWLPGFLVGVLFLAVLYYFLPARK